MNESIEVLIEKYQDAVDCADSPLEKELWTEILDDLMRLRGRANG